MYKRQELGYALQSEIHDLVFEDCDIIHCQYEGNMGGAAISIHQADGGHVHDIHYKNIRVEQAEQKLFDIKVLLCKYTEQLAKGEINDIYLGYRIRRGAIDHNIPLFTNARLASAFIDAFCLSLIHISRLVRNA